MSHYVRAFDENGRPSDKWGHADKLFAHLLHHRRELSKGSGGFTSFFQVAQWRQLISGVLCVVLPNKELLNEPDTTRIFLTALEEVASTDESDTTKARKRFVHLCEKQITALLSHGEQTFTLYTSLSVPESATGELAYQGVVMTFAALDDPGPVLPAILNEELYADLRNMWARCRYRRTRVTVTALTANEALRKGLRVVDLVRAVVSLRHGMGKKSLQLIGKRKDPLALIHVGPLHLVAEGTGKECVNDVWAEELYTRDLPPFAYDKNWNEVAADATSWLDRLSALPYRIQMEDLLCRYVSALDETRWPIALLQLWSILEKITDTIGHDQKKLAPRASRVFPDGNLARDALEAVRCTRNSVVHSGHVQRHTERWASESKPTVEAHLYHLLFNTFDVDSTEEYAAVLDMPRASASLCREIALRRAVMRFQDARK